MQLHQLQSKIKSKNKKRIGRGGKRGTYSGRGQKGQKSRAGHKIRPAERDLIQRLPKLRGFKNKPLKSKPVVINLGDLEKKISAIGGSAYGGKGNIINREILLKAGLIRKSDKRIKILGLKSGKIAKKFQIQGIEISNQLKEKMAS